MLYRCSLTFDFDVQANSYEEAKAALKKYADLDGEQLKEYVSIPEIVLDDVECSGYMVDRLEFEGEYLD